MIGRAGGRWIAFLLIVALAAGRGAFAFEQPAATGPFVVAHNAGNDPGAADPTLLAAADVIEIDVRRRGSELVAEHSVVRSPREWLGTSSPPGSLDVAWRAVRPGAALELDLKSTDTETLRLLILYLRAHAGERTVLVSSRDPRALRALRLHAPDACRYLSVASRPSLDALLAESDPVALLDGVMVAHRLLDAATIAALQAAGLAVVAWTVNDPERAAELVAWGIDGLTTAAAAIAAAFGGGDGHRFCDPTGPESGA